MIKIIYDKDSYISNADVEKYAISFDDTVMRNLFGKPLIMYKDKWMHHLHLKVTDTCMCKCNFCIEQGKAGCENHSKYIEALDKILRELKENGLLYSVSITGGEPLTFDRLEDILFMFKKYNVPFTTMNTNGILLNDNNIKRIDGVLDFVDISRHNIDDNANSAVFMNNNIPDTDRLKYIKSKFNSTKMRLQYVITNTMCIDDIKEFVDTFYFADDFSFRSLMKPAKQHNVSYENNKSMTCYKNILKNVYKEFEFVNQTIQDYYVYETWKYRGKDLTFSYSNMKMLEEQERHEDENFARELILHPDCTLSGSWNKQHKIYYKEKN